MNIEIYSKENCKYCTMAKALLDGKNMPYSVISAVEHRAELFSRVEAATGASPKTLPQIFIDDAHVGGYDQLVERLG